MPHKIDRKNRIYLVNFIGTFVGGESVERHKAKGSIY